PVDGDSSANDDLPQGSVDLILAQYGGGCNTGVSVTRDRAHTRFFLSRTPSFLCDSRVGSRILIQCGRGATLGASPEANALCHVVGDRNDCVIDQYRRGY